MRTPPLLLIVILLAGCATKTVYVSTPLPMPLAPTLPMVQGHEVECLTENTYERLAVRETRLRAYADRLRAVIEEHNRLAAGPE